MKRKEKIIKWLFETEAIKVVPDGEAFFYTSGLIGPYYVNTHYLYGNEKKAEELLSVIENGKKDEKLLPCILTEKIDENYNSDKIFQGVIDAMVEFIKEKIDIKEIDYISGGERRDWFFSYKVADILGIPHLALYKNLKAISLRNGIVNEVENLENKNVLHIVDLTNTASSHKKSWIPAIRERGGELKWNLSVVDRDQGGSAYLSLEGIKDFALTKIDENLFVTAKEMGIINQNQMEFIHNYIVNPKESMKKFLLEKPEFLENAIHSKDEKLQMRAKLCKDANMYGLR